MAPGRVAVGEGVPEGVPLGEGECVPVGVGVPEGLGLPVARREPLSEGVGVTVGDDVCVPVSLGVDVLVVRGVSEGVPVPVGIDITLGEAAPLGELAGGPVSAAADLLPVGAGEDEELGGAVEVVLIKDKESGVAVPLLVPQDDCPAEEEADALSAPDAVPGPLECEGAEDALIEGRVWAVPVALVEAVSPRNESELAVEALRVACAAADVDPIGDPVAEPGEKCDVRLTRPLSLGDALARGLREADAEARGEAETDLDLAPLSDDRADLDSFELLEELGVRSGEKDAPRVFKPDAEGGGVPVPAPAPAEAEAVSKLLGDAGAVERADSEGGEDEEGCCGEPVGLPVGELGADMGGFAEGESECTPEAVGSWDPSVVGDESWVQEGDGDCAKEDPALLLAAALGVPGALALLLRLGGALRVAEAVEHATTLPVGGALREPRSGVELAGADGVASTLGDTALVADGGLLPRADDVACTLEECTGKSEAFGVPLWLPEDDPEGQALCDDRDDTRGEAVSPPVSDCSAVPLCANDGGALSVAKPLEEGEGEGPLLPVTTETVGSPLKLGEPVADCDAAAEGNSEGEAGAELEPDAEGVAAWDTEKDADCDCGSDAAGVNESPESVGCSVSVE